jgi:uncharacterized protein (DUF1501 family)
LASLLGGGALAALLPRWARADDPGGRRFLFVFCDGGWDPSMVFHPFAETDQVDLEAGASVGEAGALRFVDHASRPFVRSFFENWNAKAAILNGFEIRSIAHERCRQILMTGRADTVADDWCATLAGAARDTYRLPALIAAGPSYAAQYSSEIVRIGETGQLSGLLDGEALTAVGVTPPAADVAALIEAQVRARTLAFADTVSSSREQRFADAAVGALDSAAALEGADDLDLRVSASPAYLDQIVPALTALERGLCRCAMTRHRGWNAMGWDTHADNFMLQTLHFEELFRDLDQLLIDLEARPGSAGGSLLDETVVVVLSEMGRTPRLNRQDGKDHWTWTSAMLLGAGVRSGVVGGYDELGLGVPVVPSTGEIAPSPGENGAERLTSASFGATLLALGDVDSEPSIPGVAPVLALLE